MEDVEQLLTDMCHPLCFLQAPAPLLPSSPHISVSTLCSPSVYFCDFVQNALPILWNFWWKNNVTDTNELSCSLCCSRRMMNYFSCACAAFHFYNTYFYVQRKVPVELEWWYRMPPTHQYELALVVTCTACRLNREMKAWDWLAFLFTSGLLSALQSFSSVTQVMAEAISFLQSMFPIYKNKNTNNFLYKQQSTAPPNWQLW